MKRCDRGQCMKIYMVILNFFLILSGLALASIAIWMAVEHKGYGEMISSALIWAPMAVGFGLVMLGLLGCCGTVFENRCVLFFYILTASVLLILCICAGVFLIVQVHNLSRAADITNPAEVSNKNVLDVYLYEVVLYNKCCDAYTSIPRCGSMPCYPSSSTTTYQYFYEQLDPEFCNVLSELYATYDGARIPLVGTNNNGGCGNGDATVFFQVLNAYAHQSLIPGATIILALAASLLISTLFVCYLIFKPQRQPLNTYEPPEEATLELPINQHPDMDTSLVIN